MADNQETVSERASKYAARELPGLSKRVAVWATEAIKFITEMIKDMVRMVLGKE